MIELALPAWIEDFPTDPAGYPDARAKVKLAIALADENVRRDSGGPFGAVVFDGAGQVVTLAVNRVVPDNCSVAHAEMMAYMGAQQALGRARINEDGGHYTLATSAQPCCQCYGATVWAGVDELLIGARSEDVMRLTEFDEGPLPTDWAGELDKRGIRVQRDILREQACEVLRAYSARGGTMY